MEPLVVTNSITINAPKAKVWDALVNPEQTKKYMFGCETVSEWTVGSELLWKAIYEGKEMVFVKGYIVEIVPNKKLEYTVIDPNNPTIPDLPENYLDVIYELVENGNETLLTVTQSGFEHAAEGEKRYKDTYNNGEGWNPILVQIKELIEFGQ
jgi:uncharacterized protein YndB with AHSA1/START domain